MEAQLGTIPSTAPEDRAAREVTELAFRHLDLKPPGQQELF